MQALYFDKLNDQPQIYFDDPLKFGLECDNAVMERCFQVIGDTVNKGKIPNGEN